MRHLIFGSIFLIIGLSLLSPIDELLVIAPLSYLFGLWILPLWTGIAIACLGLGVFLVGNSKYIPNPISRHIWLFVSIGIAVCLYFFIQLYPW